MSYTPPPGNALTFNLSSGYTPPVGSDLEFVLGVEVPTLNISGSANVAFSRAGYYDINVTIHGESSASFLPRDQDAALLSFGSDTATFVNPDRAPRFSGVANPDFRGGGAVPVMFSSASVATFDARPYVAFRSEALSAAWFVGDFVSAAKLVSAGKADLTWKRERVLTRSFDLSGTGHVSLQARAVAQSRISVDSHSALSMKGACAIPSRIVGLSSSAAEFLGKALGSAASHFVGSSRCDFAGDFAQGEMPENYGVRPEILFVTTRRKALNVSNRQERLDVTT